MFFIENRIFKLGAKNVVMNHNKDIVWWNRASTNKSDDKKLEKYFLSFMRIKKKVANIESCL